MKNIINIKILNEMIQIGDMDVYTSLEEINEYENDFIGSYLKDSNISLGDHKSDKEIADMKESRIYHRRRSFIRTVYSTIEGIVFSIKRILLTEEQNLTNNDIMNLQETQLIGPNPTRLEEKPFHNLSFTENVKYTLKLYKEYRSPNCILNFNDSRWQEFCDTIKIRNQVTHPKSIKDLLISSDSIKRVLDSYNWFIIELNKLLNNDNKIVV